MGGSASAAAAARASSAADAGGTLTSDDRGDDQRRPLPLLDGGDGDTGGDDRDAGAVKAIDVASTARAKQAADGGGKLTSEERGEETRRLGSDSCTGAGWGGREGCTGIAALACAAT